MSNIVKSIIKKINSSEILLFISMAIFYIFNETTIYKFRLWIRPRFI